MALQTKLVQKLSQSLMMTPQLQQAIKLLQLGRLEYIEAIQQELLENPVLEEVRDEDGADDEPHPSETQILESEASPEDLHPVTGLEPQDSPVDWDRYLENIQDHYGVSTPKSNSGDEERPSIEATLSKELTFREHLLSQIRMTDIEPSDRPIIVNILGNIDRNGFLGLTYEELAEMSKCDPQDVGRVIREVLRDLDPPGAFARNLGECLLFQLEEQGLENSLAAKIVDRHLSKLERRRYDLIAKEEGVNIEEVHQAVKIITSLEPRPGRNFADEETRYVTPDIYVYKVGGEWVISLNEDGLPRLRVSPYYLEVLKRASEEDGDNKTYLNDKLKSASWLIKSIHQRQQTIFKVTESIVKYQQEFLESGIEKLKPLVLKDIAEDIGMHESTVSRVTTNKYVHTPQGVFELKFFFTTGIKSGSGEVSSSSVKERIRQLIADENPKRPISDQKIVELLGEENVQIARRTVAKYRESLGIASSSRRKQVF
ncbi:MAG: RNA polymerase factor sigma-54 [Bdellovibrionales bacterium]|nr:RNA polymerase factor sigma-54 [Bdellovibrionales bacterium]